MTDHWADVFVRFLFLLELVIPLLAGILMAIGSDFTKKRGKSSTKLKIAVGMVLNFWLVNTIALCVFGSMAEWFLLAKWEMWASYAVAFLIGLAVWLISRQKSSIEERNLTLFSLLGLATLIMVVVSFVALFTGHYPPTPCS